MKLICPHCGLKGTADDTLFAKKIRCPQCRQVFRLDETVTVTTAAESADPAICSGPVERGREVPPAPPVQEEPQDSRDVQQPAAAKALKVGVCSVCGFSLSYTYLEERAAKLFCRLCLPA